MELPELGKNCSWSTCKALDFLPLTCAYCKKIFCKDHFNQDIHKCESYKTDKINHVNIKSFICSIEECTTCSPVELLCVKCQKHFCPVHRYHDCFDIVDDIEAKKQLWRKPEQQFQESVQNVNETINKSIQKAIKDPKKQATALKIQLMRLKGKAVGTSSIPSSDRIYFLILFPKEYSKPSKPVFISKDWSVGKVIDSVSSLCDVVNKNNNPNAPKLRLFKASNGCQISNDTSVKIQDLMNKQDILNGESLILEYIEPTADVNNFVLDNFEEYKE